MAVEFLPEAKKKVDDLLERYPTRSSALIPVLWVAQKEFGCLSKEVVEYLSGILDTPPVHISDTISFYTMFQTELQGKYFIQVCHTLSCALCGTKSIVEHLKKKLNIDFGETTQDKRFTLVKVECLGSCGTAPVKQINDDYYENLTPEKVDNILKKLP